MAWSVLDYGVVHHSWTMSCGLLDYFSHCRGCTLARVFLENKIAMYRGKNGKKKAGKMGKLEKYKFYQKQNSQLYYQIHLLMQDEFL